MKATGNKTSGNERQMSESLVVASLLAMTGGFLEAYTFILHGHVFANAQTGNIALFGMSLASGNLRDAVKYLIPILAFALGVYGVEHVRTRWPQTSILHWRQSVVVAEAILLGCCFFLRGSPQDMVANLIVSIACSLQVQTFRKVNGISYASTMCTGNLRSATIAWSVWRRTRQAESRRQIFKYVAIITLFVVGSLVAVPIIGILAESSIAIPIGFLLLAGVCMVR